MPRPNTIVAAIGIKNCACNDFSNISAERPPIVVSEVNKTGLKRSTTPEIIASFIILSAFVSCCFKSSNLLSIVETRIIELLTTIPARAKSANIDKIDIVKPRT